MDTNAITLDTVKQALHDANIPYDLVYSASSGGWQIETYGNVARRVTQLDNAGFGNVSGQQDWMDDEPYALVQFTSLPEPVSETAPVSVAAAPDPVPPVVPALNAVVSETRQQCAKCNGTGQVWQYNVDAGFAHVCSTCGGIGYVWNSEAEAPDPVPPAVHTCADIDTPFVSQYSADDLRRVIAQVQAENARLTATLKEVYRIAVRSSGMSANTWGEVVFEGNLDEIAQLTITFNRDLQPTPVSAAAVTIDGA